jgi:hypothetical protein
MVMVLGGVIVWQLLKYDLKMGVSFSTASFLAVYSGIIYKSRYSSPDFILPLKEPPLSISIVIPG